MERSLMEVWEKSGFSAGLLSVEEFDHFWPDIEKMMDLVPHTWPDLTKESIVNQVLEGKMQVWGVGDTAIKMVLFTQVATFPARRVLQIFWGAGQGRIFEKAGDSVESVMEYFARSQGCTRIDVIGREGWERILAPRGFKRTSIILSREIVRSGMQ